MKRYALFLAMIVGAVGYPFFSLFAPYVQYLIFAMLILSYSKVNPKDVRIRPAHLYLLCIQLVGSLVVYALLRNFDPIVAQGGLICVLAPTATAAAAITGILGGSVSFIAGYLLICNLAVAIGGPLIFTWVGDYADRSLLESFFYICQRVVPLLVMPLVIVWGVLFFSPKIHRYIVKVQVFSFYLWLVTLAAVTANTVKSLVEQESSDYKTELFLAGVACVICIAQFAIGRRIGRRYNDRVSYGQALGQKNTLLAIWIAQTYLYPLSAIAPSAYILWQNLINSYQLWKKK